MTYTELKAKGWKETGSMIFEKDFLKIVFEESSKKGNYASCSDYDYYGSRRDGGMAEYIAVKRWNLIVLNDFVPIEQGAMLEPVAVARHAAMKLGNIQGMNILISGAGPIGLIAAQWSKLFGAKAIYFFDIDKQIKKTTV